MSSSFASGAGFISRGTQTDLTAGAPPPVAVAQAANYESKSFSSMEQYRYVSNLHTTHMASYLTYIPHIWPVIWPTYHTYGQLSDLHTTHMASYLTYIPHIWPVIWPTYHTWPVIWPTYHTYGQLSDLHTTHTASYLSFLWFTNHIGGSLCIWFSVYWLHAY